MSPKEAKKDAMTFITAALDYGAHDEKSRA